MQLKLASLKTDKKVDHSDGADYEKHSDKVSGSTWEKSSRMSKLPYFDSATDDIDAYLSRFEKFANLNKWSKDTWAPNLSAHLKGVAL